MRIFDARPLGRAPKVQGCSTSRRLGRRLSQKMNSSEEVGELDPPVSCKLLVRWRGCDERPGRAVNYSASSSAEVKERAEL